MSSNNGNEDTGSKKKKKSEGVVPFTRGQIRLRTPQDAERPLSRENRDEAAREQERHEIAQKEGPVRRRTHDLLKQDIKIFECIRDAKDTLDEPL